jgi:hypothetical protein
MAFFGCDDHQITGADMLCVGGRINPHGTVAAFTLHPETVIADGLDMFRPTVECPNIVARISKQPGIHTAHGTRANYTNFHCLHACVPPGWTNRPPNRKK